MRLFRRRKVTMPPVEPGSLDLLFGPDPERFENARRILHDATTATDEWEPAAIPPLYGSRRATRAEEWKEQAERDAQRALDAERRADAAENRLRDAERIMEQMLDVLSGVPR